MFRLRRFARSRRQAASPGPRIAIWGTFDLADYTSQILLRVYESELRARLPLAEIDAYAPLGHRHPVPMDGGRPALPLGPPDQPTKRRLADRHDLVVIVGDVVHTRDDLHADRYGIAAGDARRLRPSGLFVDGLGPELERRCPVAWSAVGVPFDLLEADAERVATALRARRHASVRDEDSRRRLAAAGADTELRVVPHPAILAARLSPADVLRKRIDYLRALDCYPAHAAPVLVQGDASLKPRAAELAQKIAEAHADVPIVLAELDESRGDRSFADAVAPLLDGAFRLPTGLAVEDVVAAIAHAASFAGTSPGGLATAAAFQVPSSPLGEPSGGTAVDDAGEGGVAEELDTLAAIAERRWCERVADDRTTLTALAHALDQARERYVALLEAHDARGDRILHERLRFAEIVEGLEEAGGRGAAAAALRIAELENALFTAQAAEAEARFELEQLRGEDGRGG